MGNYSTTPYPTYTLPQKIKNPNKLSSCKHDTDAGGGGSPPPHPRGRPSIHMEFRLDRNAGAG